MQDWQVHTAGVHSECLLSVVIPAFNYADRLPAVLSSVISQMTPACELIVIDDGSTDETLQCLKDFPVPEGVVAGFIHQDNQGPGAARNRAIALAQGKWILPVDADDCLYPDALQQILSALQAMPDTEVLLGGHEVRYESGKISRHLPPRLSENPERRVTGFLLSRTISVVHGAVVMSRRLMADCPYAEHFRQGEDLSVFAYALNREKVVTIPQILVTIYKHRDSLRHGSDREPPAIQQMADTIFSYLPSSYQQYQRRFEAQSLLSAFRRCYRAEKYARADYFFRRAASLSPRQAIQWRYLSKWLRIPLKSLRAPKERING